MLGRVLDALVQKLPVRLVSAAGGRKDNAIPNAAEAVLALAEGDLPAAKQIVSACTADLRKEYAVADPGVTVTLEEADVCPQALTEEATLRVVRYLLLVPNGIAAMSMDIPGLVQTSCNLGIFHVEDGVLTAVSSVRSSVSSQKQMLLVRIDALAQLLARRDALGWVGSTVTSLTQGYLPSDQAGTGIRFVPVWLVETDAGSFFINGITREITAEK